MGRAVVDLDEFAEAFAPIPRLMHRGQAAPAVDPKPVLDHPFAQGLARDAAIVQFAQLLTGKRRLEISLMLANEHHRQLTHGIWLLLGAPRLREASPFGPMERKRSSNRKICRRDNPKSSVARLTVICPSSIATTTSSRENSVRGIATTVVRHALQGPEKRAECRFYFAEG